MGKQATNTKELLHTALNNFERFGKEKYQTDDLVAELKLVEEDDLFETLQEWINWNDSIGSGTLTNYWGKVKQYLHYRGIKMHPMDIKQELRFPHKVEEELYGLTLEDIHKIFKSLKYKYQVLFICQLSGLMRIGEVMQLKKKHLETETKDGVFLANIRIHLPAHITKLKRSRTTFLTTEASRMLRSWVKDKEPEDIIFTKQTNARNAVSTIEQVLRRALINVGLDQRYESNDHFLINTHSFRAYGITKLSRYDENLSKKISGQKGYLLQYDRMNEEEKFEVYKKCEIDLLIDREEAQKAEIVKIKSQQSLREKVLEDKLAQITEQSMTRDQVLQLIKASKQDSQ